MTIKRVFVVVLLSCLAYLRAGDLKISVEALNFFEKGDRTIIDVNYSIKYKNLTFSENENGAISGIRVDYKANNGKKVLLDGGYTNKIVLSRIEDTKSETKEHIDRFSFDYAGDGNVLEMTFTDLVSKDSYTFKKKFGSINHRYISDIELEDYVIADSTKNLEYLHRGDMLYKSNPSRVFYQELTDSVYCYFQLNDLTKTSKYHWGYYYLLEVKDSKGKVIDSKKSKGSSLSNPASITTAVNISGLSNQMYTLSVTNLEQADNNTTVTDFSLSDFLGEIYCALPSPDEEYKLIKYLGYEESSSFWKRLPLTRKRREINRFWINYSNITKTPIREVLTLVKERVEYCNDKFSHHKKGWESERGKVYIKYGAPNDVAKYAVGDLDASDEYDLDSAIERDALLNDREYEIWRYTGAHFASYTFFDINMDNSHKLIYVYNNPDMDSAVNWRFYLGKNFDEELLK